MKSAFIIAICLFICTALFAQVKKHSLPEAKPATTGVILKTNGDSISYAAGTNQAMRLKTLYSAFNLNAIDKAMEDSLAKKKPIISWPQANGLLQSFSKQKRDTVRVFFDAANTGMAFKLLSPVDSVSYAFGLYAAGILADDYGLKTINYNWFNRGIEDGLRGKGLLIDRLQARAVLANIYRPEFQQNLIDSKKFLAKNKTYPGVITLPDGLQYMVLKKGTGPKLVQGDTVSAHYRGALINDKQFDSSYERNQPLQLTDLTLVIPGWTEGLQLMNLGAKYRFFIPPNLAYGSRHRSDIIIPYSALIFDIEIVKINNRAM